MNNKKQIFLIVLLLFATSCMKEDYPSPDIEKPELLPNREDYTSEDYGTQEIANQVAGIYKSRIGLIIYDEETRTEPIMYLTSGKTDITVKALNSGAVEISYTDFQTVIMPLKMSVTIKGLLENRNDTIFIRGTSGRVRTKLGEDMPIGTPLPESDDAELEVAYITKNKNMEMLIDLMLPIAVKALVEAEKK